MKFRTKGLITGLAATLLIALASMAASANTLSSSSTDFYITWPDLDFAAGGFEVECRVELLGTFHTRTIAKVRGALIGHVIHVDITNCAGGTAELLEEDPPSTNPWHVTFEDFGGDLPNITEIDLLLRNLHVEITPDDGPTCLADPDSNASGTAFRDASGQVRTLFAETTIGLQGGFLCALVGTGTFEGTASVEADEGELLFISLI